MAACEAQVLRFIRPTDDGLVQETIEACRAWGRAQVWINTNKDRYGNEDGWPQSIAGRAEQSIRAGAIFGSKDREVLRGRALDVSRALRGMPELSYLVLFMQYVVIKGQRKDGLWYKIPVKTKAAELGIGTNDYYKHLNGAHHWIAARLCAQDSA
jgi:hypothetical protein